ncbi:MAG: flavodoxin [Herbinix sp.]|jgi:menaquinone-dependent protoporphyrinogen IX oxidase|nr:flavodoxin [Herbinix sp.]
MLNNKKTIVIYSSKSGFTKKYAQWLVEELHCDLKEASSVSASDLDAYDTIIYGGGLYAIGLNGVKLITKNFDLLKGKKLVVYAVGATPVREETTEEVRKANIPTEQLDHIAFFYLRGGFDYSKLTLIDKFLMSLLKIKLKKAKDPTTDQKGMLASYDHPMDFTKKKYIEPLLQYISK